MLQVKVDSVTGRDDSLMDPLDFCYTNILYFGEGGMPFNIFADEGPTEEVFELIVKYNIGLKALMQQGISEPIFYGDLVYKFKRIVGKPNFSDQFKKIVKRYIRVGYNLDMLPSLHA